MKIEEFISFLKENSRERGGRDYFIKEEVKKMYNDDNFDSLFSLAVKRKYIQTVAFGNKEYEFIK